MAFFVHVPGLIKSQPLVPPLRGDLEMTLFLIEAIFYTRQVSGGISKPKIKDDFKLDNKKKKYDIHSSLSV